MNYNQPPSTFWSFHWNGTYQNHEGEILFKMDNDEVTRLVYVDFRKAFEVIDHNLLLKKLSETVKTTWTFEAY